MGYVSRPDERLQMNKVRVHGWPPEFTVIIAINVDVTIALHIKDGVCLDYFTNEHFKVRYWLLRPVVPEDANVIKKKQPLSSQLAIDVIEAYNKYCDDKKMPKKNRTNKTIFIRWMSDYHHWSIKHIEQIYKKLLKMSLKRR